MLWDLENKPFHLIQAKSFSPEVCELEHSSGLLGCSRGPKSTNPFHSLPGERCRAGQSPVLVWWPLLLCSDLPASSVSETGSDFWARWWTWVSAPSYLRWVTLCRLWGLGNAGWLCSCHARVACIVLKLLWRTCLRRQISFLNLLSCLHAQTPSWVFEAVYVVLTGCTTSPSTL